MLNQVAKLDRVFQALSDPTRRRIVERLSRGPATLSELAEPHDISLPAIMQHVKQLEECGLLRSEKQGRTRTCHVEPAGFAVVERWVNERRMAAEKRLDRLGDFLAAEESKRKRT